MTTPDVPLEWQKFHKPLTVGDLAARTGVATSALRFYEERGLISAARADSGHRRYPRGTIRRVAFIVFAQRMGLSLEEIRSELAKLPTARPPSGEDWGRLSAAWADRLSAEIAALEQLKRGLTDCIGCGCLSLERCHILNPGDRAAALGTGPRYWMGDEPEAMQGDDASVHPMRRAEEESGAHVFTPPCPLQAPWREGPE